MLAHTSSASAAWSIGSFLNVVAYRLPRGESLVSPASHCPSCGTSVKAYDNVPVLGWLMLRGRCRSCHQAISARYPVVELTTCLLAVAVVLTKHSVARHRARPRARRRARADRADRLRQPDHPEQDHAAGRDRGGRHRPRDRPGGRARAADRGRRRRRLPAVLRARLSARDGNGRRQARRRARSVPRPRGRRRRCSPVSSPARSSARS